MTKKTNKIRTRMIEKPELFDHIEDDIYCLPRVVRNHSYSAWDGRAAQWIEHGLFRVASVEAIEEYKVLIKSVMELCECTQHEAINALERHSVHKKMIKSVITRKEIDYIKKPLYINNILVRR